jgi:hypothetical protein
MAGNLSRILLLGAWCAAFHNILRRVNATKTILRTSQPAQSAPRSASPTMYLVRLRAHLSQGRIALGQAIEAVGDALPLRGGGKDRQANGQ